MARILVAYFSASGVTRKVADNLARAIGADLYEIAPEVPYTRADLNWMNRKSRSSVEMKDRSSRPSVATKVENMQDYDTVFLGFPIWWYREPSIVDTFMESYDFNGKTIVPFATSGSSGLGDTSKNLESLCPGARVVEGKRFASRVSGSALKEWAEKYIM